MFATAISPASSLLHSLPPPHATGHHHTGRDFSCSCDRTAPSRSERSCVTVQCAKESSEQEQKATMQHKAENSEPNQQPSPRQHALTCCTAAWAAVPHKLHVPATTGHTYAALLSRRQPSAITASAPESRHEGCKAQPAPSPSQTQRSLHWSHVKGLVSVLALGATHRVRALILEHR